MCSGSVCLELVAVAAEALALWRPQRWKRKKGPMFERLLVLLLLLLLLLLVDGHDSMKTTTTTSFFNKGPTT